MYRATEHKKPGGAGDEGQQSFNWRAIEWPTVVAIAACYSLWFGMVFYGSIIPAPLWIVISGLISTFYWSLVHEIIHGHPTSDQRINDASVFLSLGWFYPVGRFRDTHLQHHVTGELTDPFDDPESWYVSGPNWRQSLGFSRFILKFNNTLLGRMLIGPFISIFRFYINEIQVIWQADEEAMRIVRSWSLHLGGVLILVLIVLLSPIPIWQVAASAYLGISFLLVRTFLEHQACEIHGERTVIIERLCPIAFLFLFNNLHCVHHSRPRIAWYKLPAFYKAHREAFIDYNNGYVYSSYFAVFKKYFFHAKEPVMHPFLRQEETGVANP
ncbi:MAG: fatty acid desaturase [Rhizobiaceae bacterium]|nr:fatty acid desaturase [Rhizobiaceae bacterium]